MIWKSWDDRKIGRNNTVCHRVVYVPDVMRHQIMSQAMVLVGNISQLNGASRKDQLLE